MIDVTPGVVADYIVIAVFAAFRQTLQTPLWSAVQPTAERVTRFTLATTSDQRHDVGDAWVVGLFRLRRSSLGARKAPNVNGGKARGGTLAFSVASFQFLSFFFLSPRRRKQGNQQC